jgi:hypothetical protein
MTVTPPAYRQGMAEAESRWNPWRALRARADARLVFDYLPDECGGGRVEAAHGGFLVVLDHRLDRRRRRCVLGHEIVHVERGILFHPSTPGGLVQKEEAIVNREATDRLVPPHELAELVGRLSDLGEPVRALDVVEEFDVDVATAQRALALLEMRGR